MQNALIFLAESFMNYEKNVETIEKSIFQEFSRVVADNPSMGFSQIFPKILSTCPLP